MWCAHPSVNTSDSKKMCVFVTTRGHKGNSIVCALKSQATDLSTEEKD